MNPCFYKFKKSFYKNLSFKEEATKALIEKTRKKVWSYQELGKIRKLFDAELSQEEKKKIDFL